METDTCIKCNKTKPISKFEKDKGMRKGYRNVCGSCRYKRRRELPSWEKRSKYNAEFTLEWRKQNPHYSIEWREKNSDYHKDYFKNNKEYFYEAYKKYKEANKEHCKKMISSQSRVNRFLKLKEIERPLCQHCGNISKHMHHKDYNKPYDVVFLCIGCHRKVHSGVINCPEPINLMQYGYV